MSSHRAASRSMEPFTGTELNRWLESIGCELERQTGSHLRYRTPDGRAVGGYADNMVVPKSLMREVCRTLDMDYRQARDAIGFPVRKSGKRRTKVPATKRKQATGKGSVLDRVSAARERLNEIDSALRSGSRDPAVYATCLDLLDEASTAIQRAADVAAGRRAA